MNLTLWNSAIAEAAVNPTQPAMARKLRRVITRLSSTRRLKSAAIRRRRCGWRRKDRREDDRRRHDDDEQRGDKQTAEVSLDRRDRAAHEVENSKGTLSK